jgi:excisionase family DNA binding protein
MSTLGAIGDSVLALFRDELRRAFRDELRLAIQGLEASTPTPKEFLSVREAAELLDVSETTVREWIAAGLRPYQQGRVVRLHRPELLAFLAVVDRGKKLEVDVEEHAVALLTRARKG